MDSEVLGPLIFFGFLAAIILVPVIVKERTKRSAHDLISQAMARGQQLDPELVSKLSQSVIFEADRARKSLGNAVILLALAGGFVAAGFVVDGFDPGGDAHRGMLIPAVIFGSIGVAFLLLSIVDYVTKPRTA